MRTEMGKIAGPLAAGEDPESPLQRQLETVGRTLTALCLAIVAVVSVPGLLRGMAWLEVLLSAVTLAVAARQAIVRLASVRWSESGTRVWRSWSAWSRRRGQAQAHL